MNAQVPASQIDNEPLSLELQSVLAVNLPNSQRINLERLIYSLREKLSRLIRESENPERDLAPLELSLLNQEPEDLASELIESDYLIDLLTSLNYSRPTKEVEPEVQASLQNQTLASLVLDLVNAQ